MTKEQIAAVLEKVRDWPQQDQQELAELAREIEARRSGRYVLTAEEDAALDAATKTPLVPEAEAADFWKKRGVE
jgi:hypothetical protein